MVGPENDKIGQSIEYNTRMNKNKNILTVRLRKYLFLLLMADDGDPSFTFQCFQATYGTPVVPIDWSTNWNRIEGFCYAMLRESCGQSGIMYVHDVRYESYWCPPKCNCYHDVLSRTKAIETNRDQSRQIVYISVTFTIVIS
jgi:hypothetical protein